VPITHLAMTAKPKSSLLHLTQPHSSSLTTRYCTHQVV